MHVPAAADGGPHVVIPAGTTWSPSFQVLDKAATHWYHPHLHMNTNTQVQQGIAGMIIVRDPEEQALNLPRTYGVDDFPIVVQTKAFDSNNQIIIESALDENVLVNGTLNAFLEAPAQMIRLRLLNGASERTFNFGFTNNQPFYQIASDGSLLSSPVTHTRLDLSPGERAEVVLDLSTMTGQTIFLKSFASELPNAVYGAAQPGMGAGQVIPNYSNNPLNGNDFDILQINVVASTVDPVPVNTLPTTLTTHSPWLASEADNMRTFVFEPEIMGPGAINGPFMINNAMFDMDVINEIVPLDNIEIWELTNMSPIGHPFHLHDVSFYILTIDGAAPPAHMQGKKDVVFVPGGGSVVQFITKFEDYADDMVPYMYHCHILTHEDMGMMGQFIVTDKVGIEEKTSKDFTVFPNPANDHINLMINKGLDATQYSIVDQSGRIIRSGFIPSNNKISIEELDKGIYTMTIGDQFKPEFFIKN
jgi:bilirubin oxidase